jgi:hypothetical protein
MKQCKDCGQVKPMDEFYRHSSMVDGHLNICKSCKIEYQAKRSTIPEVREREKVSSRQWATTDKGRESHRKFQNSEKGRESKARWKRDHPDLVARYNDVSRSRFPDKISARYTAGKKVPLQSCVICNTTEGIHRHHNDYTKPLEVVFLCSKHHGEIHRKQAA